MCALPPKLAGKGVYVGTLRPHPTHALLTDPCPHTKAYHTELYPHYWPIFHTDPPCLHPAPCPPWCPLKSCQTGMDEMDVVAYSSDDQG